MSILSPRRAPSGSAAARQPSRYARHDRRGAAAPAMLQKALFYACLALLGALVLGNCVVSAVLALLLPARRRRDASRATISCFARVFFAAAEALRLVRLDLSALDALDAERGLIIAPNHPSMLDALLVASRVRHLGCIMKAGLWNIPFLGHSARLAHYIRNDSTHAMIRQAAADLAAGGQLLIFPEGTRTIEAPANPLKGGITLIAQRSGATIQTVLIEADSRYLGKGWPLFRVPAFPLTYRATLGPRFQAGCDRGETLAAMQAFYATASGQPSAADRLAPRPGRPRRRGFGSA